MNLKELLEENNIVQTKPLDQYGKDAEVIFDKSVSRQTGTGYKDYYYKIKGFDDAIVIHKNMHSQGEFFSTCETKENYYSQAKEYGKECGRLSRKYDIPWDVCKVLGTDEKIYPKFKEKVNSLSFYDVMDCDAYYNSAGIARRNSEIRNLLPEDEFSGLSRCGQQYSSVMFDYLFEKIFENEKEMAKRIEETNEYKNLTDKYNLTPENAVKFISVIDYKWGFFERNEADRMNLINTELDLLTRHDNNFRNFVEHGKIEGKINLEDNLTADDYLFMTGEDGIDYKKERLYDNGCYTQVLDAEKQVWANLKTNEIKSRLEKGQVISERYLIQKLGDFPFNLKEADLNYITKYSILNAIAKNDYDAIKENFSEKTYKEKIMPEKVAKDLSKAIILALHEKAHNINFSNINYQNVMEICAPIRKLDKIEDDKKALLQKQALKTLLTQNEELAYVVAVEGGIDFHSEEKTKTSLFAELVNNYPEKINEKYDKIMEFFKTDFDNTKAFSKPGDYPGDVDYYSEMYKFFEEELLDEEFPELKEDNQKEVSYCVKELRNGDAFTAFTDGTALFGKAIQPEIEENKDERIVDMLK